MTENENEYFCSFDPKERMAMIEGGQIDPLMVVDEYHNGCHPIHSFCTPALKVVMNGTVEELEQLKNKGLVLDKVYKWDNRVLGGWETTLLWEAIGFGRLDMVDYLFNNGVVPSAKEVKDVATLCPKDLHILIERGVDVNSVDEETGNTILHHLCYGMWLSEGFEGAFDDYREAIRYALDHGADPTIKNKEGNTPLDDLKNDGLEHLVEGIL